MNDHPIPADRTPYDVHGRLEDPMVRLAVALGQWERRDDTRSQPEVRRAANTAMDAIDAMVRELHLMRARLVSEMRVSDDAAAARADKLIAGTDALLGDLNRPADPLVRKLRFEAAHPDVTITEPETHASLWTARADGKLVASGYQLAELLDALDWWDAS